MLERIETGIARAISFILHPMLLPTYALVILFNLQVYFTVAIPLNAKWMIAILVFIITGLLPILLTVLMSKLGIIRSLHMSEREERIWPFITTALLYYLAYHLLKQLDLSPVFVRFMLGAFLAVAAGLVVSFFWKISIHMIGMGGLVGAFTGLSLRLMIDMPLLIVILILLSGLTGFARLKLSAHHPLQVLAGFIAGFGVYILLFLIR
jgi:membrane-associated phospholipid phosphatase